LAGDENKDTDKDAEKEAAPIIDKLKKALGERVKDVRVSKRLHVAPCCIVADADDPSLQMAQMLKAMGEARNLPEIKPILEVNIAHPLVKSLTASDDEARIADIAGVLLGQALLVEGIKLPNSADFVKQLNRLLSPAA
jgi:molecular chaperone HtpG